jgi:hypothetical protein
MILRKKEEGRGKKEEGRRKREEGRGKLARDVTDKLYHVG